MPGVAVGSVRLIPQPRQFRAETRAAIAAMTARPTRARARLIDDLIRGLQADGVWSRLDWLSVHAAHDEQAGRLNLVNPATGCATGASDPTFTADRGVTGNGSTTYLNTQWNASTAGGEFTQNDNSFGVYSTTDVAANGQFEAGTTNARSTARNGSDQFAFSPQGGAAVIGGVDSSIGLFGWSRTGATEAIGYRNGAAIGTVSSNSVVLRNAPFLICGSNSATNGGITLSGMSTRRVSAVCWGSSLSAALQLALYNRLNAYLTAIGAV